jgi:probable addiction module antidote protein
MAAKKRTAKKRARRKVKPERLSRWDSAEYLRNEDDIAGYFEAALEEAGDDPAYMLHVLNTIARARGMMKLASKAGITRAGLYKALAPDAKPSVQTVHKIAKALGFRLTLTRAA